METKKTAAQQIQELVHLLPLEVLSDINKRLTDHASTGGGDDDPYVYQQLRFAKNYLKLKENRDV